MLIFLDWSPTVLHFHLPLHFSWWTEMATKTIHLTQDLKQLTFIFVDAHLSNRTRDF